MGTFKVKYLVSKARRGVTYHFWEPKPRYKVFGLWQDTPAAIAAQSLGTDPAAAHSKAIALNERLVAWRKGKDASRPVVKDTVDWLIAGFKGSKLFRDMAPATQKNYLGHFKDISPVMGDVPVDKVSSAMAYGFCTSFVDNPRKPSAIASTGRALFKFARFLNPVYDKMPNPFAELGISKPRPRKEVWTHAQEEALGVAAKRLGWQDVHDAAVMGLYAAQRPQDVRAVANNQYDWRIWRVTQKKTGAVVEIPVYKIPKLKAVMDRLKVNCTSPILLICKATGKPFSKELLCTRFRELCNEAGIPENLQYRDFRRTAVVRLAEAGCTNAEIAAITGHSIDSVGKMLAVYLPTSAKMGHNAATKLARWKP